MITQIFDDFRTFFTLNKFDWCDGGKNCQQNVEGLAGCLGRRVKAKLMCCSAMSALDFSFETDTSPSLFFQRPHNLSRNNISKNELSLAGVLQMYENFHFKYL